MKGFRFRLEPVLELRRHREEDLQRKLAEAQRALDAETARLESLRGEMSDQARLLAERRGPGPLDLDDLSTGSAYLAGLEQQVRSQTNRVDQQSAFLVGERNAVLQAARDRMALEKVREGLRLSYVRETARKEQKTAEEMSTVRHLRLKEEGERERG